MDPWNSHDWSPSGGRVLEIRGRDLRHHSCAACGRDFIEELDSGFRYAVHVGITGFDRLSDEVNFRWMTSKCPGQQLASDQGDRQRRFKPPDDAA
jgi:hypothetical protein